MDVIVRGLHEIEEGSEVLLSYFSIDQVYGNRHNQLQENYGFWCKCARCTVESKWKDDDNEEKSDNEAGASDVRIGKNIPANVESSEGYKDDFGHAMFFMKYLYHVEE